MWLLYQEAITWKSTPAELIGVDDEYTAYCLNQAVSYVGKFIDGEMDKASDKAKTTKAAESARQRVLDKYLTPSTGGKSGFMDPAGMFS